MKVECFMFLCENSNTLPCLEPINTIHDFVNSNLVNNQTDMILLGPNLVYMPSILYDSKPIAYDQPNRTRV